VKNENDIRKDTPPIVLKIIIFIQALWPKTCFFSVGKPKKHLLLNILMNEACQMKEGI